MSSAPVFLTAEWRHLVMLNYAVEPSILESLVPAGTQLDTWSSLTFVSIVGFLFLNTKVLGVPIPLHRDFEEVNLRFYVRRETREGQRRGVVFVKELVPRAAIAWTARLVYNENYEAVPMSHRIERHNGNSQDISAVTYSWQFRGQPQRVGILVEGNPAPIEEGSEQEFIAEHYWGYARQRHGGTKEYRVEHPRWHVWRAKESYLECDVAGLYGEAFKPFLSVSPVSAFLADGSPVTVYRGTEIAS